jgi:dihydroneopterin aldolase
MSRIFLRGIRMEAMVGIYRRERVTRQPIELDLDIDLPTDAVFASGEVADTIDYAAVTSRLRAELGARRFGLVENLAEFIAQLLLQEFRSPRVRVSVSKLGILPEVMRVGVEIERRAPQHCP